MRSGHTEADSLVFEGEACPSLTPDPTSSPSGAVPSTPPPSRLRDNYRIENSNLPVRRRERKIQRFKSKARPRASSPSTPPSTMSSISSATTPTASPPNLPSGGTRRVGRCVRRNRIIRSSCRRGVGQNVKLTRPIIDRISRTLLCQSHCTFLPKHCWPNSWEDDGRGPTASITRIFPPSSFSVSDQSFKPTVTP